LVIGIEIKGIDQDDQPLPALERQPRSSACACAPWLFSVKHPCLIDQRIAQLRICLLRHPVCWISRLISASLDDPSTHAVAMNLIPAVIRAFGCDQSNWRTAHST
jgi:hypothetical protein